MDSVIVGRLWLRPHDAGPPTLKRIRSRSLPGASLRGAIGLEAGYGVGMTAPSGVLIGSRLPASVRPSRTFDRLGPGRSADELDGVIGAPCRRVAGQPHS